MFFDNLQVVHTRGALLEETHYYPFGLTMAGISSKAITFGGFENKLKYQQYEFNSDFNIILYETFYRSHDPQLGRFWQIDPKPRDYESPYLAIGNNPIINSDPLGDTLDVPVLNGGSTATDKARRIASENDLKSPFVYSSNQKFLTFSPEGRVSIDRALAKQEDALMELVTDPGYKLLRDIISAPELYQYAATASSPTRDFTPPSTFSKAIHQNLHLQYPPGSIIDGIRPTITRPLAGGGAISLSDINLTISNLSMTRRGDEAGAIQAVPGARQAYGSTTRFYDGQVNIARGVFFNGSLLGIPAAVSRPSMVYHELAENYMRTQYKLLYIDAHNAANNRARLENPNNYGNRNIGKGSSYFKVLR